MIVYDYLLYGTCFKKREVSGGEATAGMVQDWAPESPLEEITESFGGLQKLCGASREAWEGCTRLQEV